MREVKCFLMRLPFQVRELSFYRIYQEMNYSEDELSFEILNLLKDKANFHRKYQAFSLLLCQYLDFVPVESTIKQLQEELRLTLTAIIQELTDLDLYNERGRLPFNALWFDHPNCLMFYVMNKGDVEYEFQTVSSSNRN